MLAEETKRGARRDQLHGEEPTELGKRRPGVGDGLRRGGGDAPRDLHRLLHASALVLPVGQLAVRRQSLAARWVVRRFYPPRARTRRPVTPAQVVQPPRERVLQRVQARVREEPFLSLARRAFLGHVRGCSARDPLASRRALVPLGQQLEHVAADGGELVRQIAAPRVGVLAARAAPRLHARLERVHVPVPQLKRAQGGARRARRVPLPRDPHLLRVPRRHELHQRGARGERSHPAKVRIRRSLGGGHVHGSGEATIPEPARTPPVNAVAVSSPPDAAGCRRRRRTKRLVDVSQTRANERRRSRGSSNQSEQTLRQQSRLRGARRSLVLAREPRRLEGGEGAARRRRRVVLEESAHETFGSVTGFVPVRDGPPYPRGTRERQQRRAVHDPPLGLGVPHDDAAEQRVKQREGVGVFRRPRSTDTVRPEAVRLVGETKRPNPQEGQFAVEVVDAAVERGAGDHPPEIGDEASARHRELRGGRANHLTLVEDDPSPRDARQDFLSPLVPGRGGAVAGARLASPLLGLLLQRRVRRQDDVVVRELRREFPLGNLPRRAPASSAPARVYPDFHRPGTHALGALSLPLSKQGRRDDDERRPRRYQPVAVLLLALSPLLRVVLVLVLVRVIRASRPLPVEPILLPLLLLLRLGRLLLRGGGLGLHGGPRRVRVRAHQRQHLERLPQPHLLAQHPPANQRRLRKPKLTRQRKVPVFTAVCPTPLLPEHPVQPALAPFLVPHPRQRLPLEVHQGQGEVGRCGALVVSVADGGGEQPGKRKRSGASRVRAGHSRVDVEPRGSENLRFQRFGNRDWRSEVRHDEPHAVVGDHLEHQPARVHGELDFDSCGLG